MKKQERNSRKKIQTDYDIGAMVAKAIEDDQRLSYQIVADKMGIGKAALIAKTKLPYFGTADTILDASRAIGENLFNPFIEQLKQEGIPSNDEFADLKAKYDKLLIENEELRSDRHHFKVLNQVLIERMK